MSFDSIRELIERTEIEREELERRIVMVMKDGYGDHTDNIPEHDKNIPLEEAGVSGVVDDLKNGAEQAVDAVEAIVDSVVDRFKSLKDKLSDELERVKAGDETKAEQAVKECIARIKGL